MGIRASDERTDEVIRSVLADHVVDVEASANYSVRFETAKSRGSRPLHVAYGSGCPIVRSSDRAEVLRSLFGHLSGIAANVDADITLDTSALIHDDSAILLPYYFRNELVDQRRRLERNGLILVDRPWATVDSSTGELVVGPNLWDPPPELEEQKRSRLGFPAPGRFPITHWLLPLEGSLSPHNGPSAIYEAMRCTRTRDVPNTSAFLAVRRLLDKAIPVGIGSIQRSEAVQRLSSLIAKPLLRSS